MSVAASVAIHALLLLWLISVQVPSVLRLPAELLDVSIGALAPPGGGGGGASADVPVEAPGPIEPVEGPSAVARPTHRPRVEPVVASTEVATVVGGAGGAESEGTGTGIGPGEGSGTGGGTGSGDGTGTGDGTGDGPRCGDAFNGVWVGRVYFRPQAAWSEIQLTMTRAGDRLSGTIVNHEWEGAPTRTRPVPCIDGGYEWRVRMPAAGTIHEHAFSFDSDHYEVMPNSCWRQGSHYNPDRFVGRIDEDAERLEVTWYDDGALQAGQAIHFRRVGCVDEPPR